MMAPYSILSLTVHVIGRKGQILLLLKFVMQSVHMKRNVLRDGTVITGFKDNIQKLMLNNLMYKSVKSIKIL
jgi:hypothetical protein